MLHKESCDMTDAINYSKRLTPTSAYPRETAKKCRFLVHVFSQFHPTYPRMLKFLHLINWDWIYCICKYYHICYEAFIFTPATEFIYIPPSPPPDIFLHLINWDWIYCIYKYYHICYEAFIFTPATLTFTTNGVSIIFSKKDIGLFSDT